MRFSLLVGMMAAAFSLPPPSLAQLQPDTPAASTQEAARKGRPKKSMTIDVTSGSEGTDRVMKEELAARLSRNFRILEFDGEFTVHLEGKTVDSFDTLIHVKALSLAIGESDEVIEYDAYLHMPGRNPKQVGNAVTLSSLSGVVSQITRTISMKYPPTGTIRTLEGDWADIDLGSDDGLRTKDRLEVIESGGRAVGLLEIHTIAEYEARARRIRGQLPEEGATVRRLWPWTFGAEMAYIHFSVDGKAGRDILLRFIYSERRVLPVVLLISTGYIDVIQENGWHILNLDAVKQWEIVPERFLLEMMAGGGYSALRIEGQPPEGQEQVPALGMANFEVFVGAAVHFSRALILDASIGYLGYSRFPMPTSPSLQLGFRWMMQ